MGYYDDWGLDEPYYGYQDYLDRDQEYDYLYSYPSYNPEGDLLYDYADLGYDDPTSWLANLEYGGGALEPQSFGLADLSGFASYDDPAAFAAPAQDYSAAMQFADDGGPAPDPYADAIAFADQGGMPGALPATMPPAGAAPILPGQPPQPGQPTPGRTAAQPGAPNARSGAGGGSTMGNIVQGALGLGGLGLMAAGLGKKSPKVRAPDRSGPIQLSPQEQAAANTMAASRAAASGTMEARGYAGEEAIRNRLNEQLSGMLGEEEEIASPRTTRMLNEQRVALSDRLRQELGPGFFTSTAGQNALRNFEEYAAEVLDAERERRLATRNTMALSRSQFARQLEQDPFNMAQAELGSLSGIGAQQAALRMQADTANAAQAGADKRALLTTGGQMAGVAVAPYLHAALAELVDAERERRLAERNRQK